LRLPETPILMQAVRHKDTKDLFFPASVFIFSAFMIIFEKINSLWILFMKRTAPRRPTTNPTGKSQWRGIPGVGIAGCCRDKPKDKGGLYQHLPSLSPAPGCDISVQRGRRHHNLIWEFRDGDGKVCNSRVGIRGVATHFYRKPVLQQWN